MFRFRVTEIFLCRDLQEDGTYRIRVPVGSSFFEAFAINFRLYLFYSLKQDQTPFDNGSFEFRRILLSKDVPYRIQNEALKAYLGAVSIRPTALRLLLKAPAVLHIFELPDIRLSATQSLSEVDSAV